VSMWSGFDTEASTPFEQGNKLAFRFKTTCKRDHSRVVFEGENIPGIEWIKIIEDLVYFEGD